MKKNKGFTSVAIIVVIVVVLVIVGGAYYLGKNSSLFSKGEIGENLPDVNKTEDQKSDTKIDQEIKTETNIKGSYQINYPTSWFVKNYDEADSFTILNEKDAILPGTDFGLKTSGSYININVTDNMNYSNYRDFVKDPKWMLSEKTINQRLANLGVFTIDGKKFEAFTGIKSSGSLPMESYAFIYNGKMYKISYISGSNEQFSKDKGVFDAIISSFKFLNSEESASEIFKNQPGAIKSIKADGINKWILEVDLLTKNSNWIPGGDGSVGFFVNQNTKIRNLNMDNFTKIINCTTQYNGYASGFNNNLSSFINYAKDRINKKDQGDFGYTVYFDIDGTNITTIYEQCLP